MLGVNVAHEKIYGIFVYKSMVQCMSGEAWSIADQNFGCEWYISSGSLHGCDETYEIIGTIFMCILTE